MTKWVSFFQFSGGSSKTSTVRDVGFVLARRGFRVLLVDLDPQASLTQWLGIDRDGVDLADTVFPALESDGGSLPMPLRVHGLDVLPSTTALARAEPALLSSGAFAALRLREALRAPAFVGAYDVVLIDSPPSLGQITAAAVLASDFVVVPLLAQAKGAEGVQVVVDMVRAWRRGVPHLRIALFVLAQIERTAHNQSYLRLMREQLSAIAPVSTPLVRRPGVYQNAMEGRVPVPLLGRFAAEATLEIEAVASELLSALGVSADVVA
jgi:chromosome partitioning protein